MSTAIVLFTRDLRVHDHPALTEALRDHQKVIAMFVHDAELQRRFGSPNRLRFLDESVADLDRLLDHRMVIRRGDTADEVMAVAARCEARAIYATRDFSSFAKRRQERLQRATAPARIELRLAPGTAVLDPDCITPTGQRPLSVFTAYYRRWLQQDRRAVLPAPDLSRLIRLDSSTSVSVREGSSTALARGGESAGRARMMAWLREGLARYASEHNNLAGDATSRLSPYLHFGCVSPNELAATAARHQDGEAFVRQLCWRDFYLYLLDRTPALPRRDFRSLPSIEWREDDAALEAWKQGCTGFPIVDAGMRQLQLEGWMHNRARLITASFLTKDLGIDWRTGAAHFSDLLVDGDIANNSGNWQWVAGTGPDTRPYRMFNPTLQAQRFDPAGDYVRRYVSELRGVAGAAVHQPDQLSARARNGYPTPIVDHAQAARRFRSRFSAR